ncbi:phloem protein 2-A9 [Rhynchospora pubera]|uniref:Phloem protein 2-A9 n=1 Tax=Rhynchospora pubera TaxID=906938 RepID=A0AAV8E931_9POAL|nr:phloem protein 2-A9 [Rhynchospora pubera]
MQYLHHNRNVSTPDRQQHTKIEGDQVIVNALALDITHGGDERYWHIDEESRSAELKRVSWLEVTGSIDMFHLEAEATYKLEFKIRMKPGADGWDECPVYIMVKPGKGKKFIWAKVTLNQNEGEQRIPSDVQFTTPLSTVDDKVSFALLDVWNQRYKNGLVIEEVVISKVPVTVAQSTADNHV